MSIAGALRERVDLSRNEAITTDAGDRADEWIVYAAKVPARMQPKRASEVVRAMREINESRYAVTIRKRSDVAAGHRLTWGARTFSVDGVLNLDEHGHYLTLDCVEISI